MRCATYAPLRRGLKNGKYNSAPRHICRPLPVSHQPTKARPKRCPAPSGCFGQADTPLPCITAPPVQPRIPARRHPSRQERMPCLRLPAFPCRKTPLPPRGDAPVERRRHRPEPQRLGTEPDGGLLGRLPGTPRAADSPLPPPQKRKRERHLMSRPRCRLCSHRAFPASPPHLLSREYRLGDAPTVKGGCHA